MFAMLSHEHFGCEVQAKLWVVFKRRIYLSGHHLMRDGDAFHDKSKSTTRIFHLEPLSNHANEGTELQKSFSRPPISGF